MKHKLHKVQHLSPKLEEKTHPQLLQITTLLYHVVLASKPIPEDVYLFKKYLLGIHIAVEVFIYTSWEKRGLFKNTDTHTHTHAQL